MLVSRKVLWSIMRIMFSCFPIMSPDDQNKAKEVIRLLAGDSQCFRCSWLSTMDFGRAFSRILRELRISAMSHGLTEITTNLVWQCFGGDGHIKHIKQIFAENNFTLCEKKIFFFTHMLVPIKLIKTDPISALYENDDARVVMANLNNYFKTPLQVGNWYYSHFNIIIASVDEQAVVENLLSQQRADPDLLLILRSLKIVDFDKFWDKMDIK